MRGVPRFHIRANVIPYTVYINDMPTTVKCMLLLSGKDTEITLSMELGCVREWLTDN